MEQIRKFPLPNKSSILLLLAVLCCLQPCTGVSQSQEQREARALTLFQEGEQMELRGRISSAIERYRGVAREFRGTEGGAQAQFRIAQLFHQNKEFVEAFQAYERLIENFPASDLFLQAIAGEFEIVEECLARMARKRRTNSDVPGIPLPKNEVVRDMLRVILTQARFGDYAARAKYLAGVQYQISNDLEGAREAFRRVTEQHPEHLLAVEAAFQIAYATYLNGTDEGVHRGTLEFARRDLEDFIIRYPGSEKIPEAKYCLRRIDLLELKYLLQAMKFYEKQGKPQAAEIYRAEILQLVSDPNRKPSLQELEVERVRVESIPGDIYQLEAAESQNSVEAVENGAPQ